MDERSPRPSLEELRAGFGKPFDLEIVEHGPEGVVVRAPVTAGLAQALGYVHGGALVTLADIAATLAAHAAGEGRDHLTSSLTSHFLAPVTDGVLEAEARPLRVGKRQSVWEVEVRQRDVADPGDGQPVSAVRVLHATLAFASIPRAGTAGRSD